MRRLVVVTAVAIAGVVAAMPAVASAGKPANQACVGKSLSALAMNQPAPGSFGAGVVGFAQAPDARPGLGDGIANLAAGAVPDDLVENTCND